MSLKLKTILFSICAISVLVVSLFIFREYKTTNTKLYKTISTLDRVNHAGHEIAIGILLDLRDFRSLDNHLNEIPVITHQFQEISWPGEKPPELIEMEMSFVRVKKVIENQTLGQDIQEPVLEQINNEVQKISSKVAKLKKLSEDEFARLQARSEVMISVLYSILALYIVSMFVLLFQIVIKPILIISDQIEKIGQGDSGTVAIPPRKDEIGRLAETFNRMNEKRKQTEKALKQEIEEHRKTHEEVKILSGFLPICAACKKIRDDRGYWNQIEMYIREHSEAEFSHSICPDCAAKLYAGFLSVEKPGPSRPGGKDA